MAKRVSRGVGGGIDALREAAEKAAYYANYYTAIGHRNKALPYYEKLKKIFAEADKPEYAAEDLRHDLQARAAKQRKVAIYDGRRHQSNLRKDRVARRNYLQRLTPEQRAWELANE